MGTSTHRHGSFDPGRPLLAWTTAGAAGGASLGAWLMTDKLQGRQVKVIIGVVLLGVVAKMLWDLV